MVGVLDWHRFTDAESPSAQDGVLVILECNSAVGRQSRPADRRERVLGELRPRVEAGCNEHVTGDAANSVELDVHSLWVARIPGGSAAA